MLGSGRDFWSIEFCGFLIVVRAIILLGNDENLKIQNNPCIWIKIGDFKFSQFNFNIFPRVRGHIYVEIYFKLMIFNFFLWKHLVSLSFCF